jgi:hypothetical protein
MTNDDTGEDETDYPRGILVGNEKWYQIIPPDANVRLFGMVFNLMLATVALALPILQFVQGNQVNILSAVVGVSLFLIEYVKQR